MTRLPALAIVEYALLRAAPSLAASTHVADVLTAFVDASQLLSPAKAASTGSVRLFERVIRRYDASSDGSLYSFWCARTMEAAIEKNDLAMVQKIHELHPGPLGVRSLSVALKHGTLEMVQWIVTHRSDRLCCAGGVRDLCRACVSEAMCSIGKQDTARVVMWCHLQDLFDPATASTPVLCTMRQCPELFEWYELSGVLKNFTATQIISSAFAGGNFDMERLLLTMLERSSSFREDATLASLQCLAMKPGQEDHVERLLATPKYRHIADKVKFDPIRVGGSGRRVLQWDVPLMRVTRVDYVPMIQMVQRMAQQHAHIDTMEWLATKCGVASFTPPLWPIHSESEQIEVCSWLLSTGRGDWTMMPLDRAIQMGHLSLVQWFHTHRPGDFTPRTMDTAAGEGRLGIVQWLHANRAEGCTQRAMESAAFAGHVEIVQWLHENRAEGHTNFAMTRAVLSGHLDVVAWLHTNRRDACGSCVLQFLFDYAHTMMGDTPVLHTLSWLDSHATCRDGCKGACCALPPSRLTRDMAVTALNVGDVTLLAYLYEHHGQRMASWPNQRARIARILVERGHMGCIQWMYEHHRDDCDWQVVRAGAAKNQFTAITAWLDATL